MNLYLDATVIVPVLAEQSMSANARTFLIQASPPILVSDFAAAEVASAISRLVRMNAMIAADGHAALADFDVWLTVEAGFVESESADVRSAAALVRRFELMLRTPDALHLALCERLDSQLITFDRRLATAAEALSLSVRVLQAE